MASPAVIFDYDAWVGRYPEFLAVAKPMAQAYFNEAGIYCANDSCSAAFGAGVLPVLLNQLTAHIAWLNAPRGPNGMPAATGQPASPLVGRISSASEGSVSVSVENSFEPGTPQWYQQTKYGAAYWAATAQFRTAQYAPQPIFVGAAIFPYGGRRW